MALVPRLVEVVETDTLTGAPRTTTHNAYENKVVNADIRIRSVRDEADFGEVEDAPGEELVEQHSQPGAQHVKEHERAEEMQTWWNTAMKKYMNQPDGYEKVAVLLVKWADELDELKTKKETLELDALFRNKFHYSTKIVELDVRRKAQHQLSRQVSTFIENHDGPNNLLIVYYTGHGSYREDKKYLELTATHNPDTCKGFSKDARANWNKVEAKLKDDEIDGDVLIILDTCYASNHVKSASSETKKFELLSACAIDQTTAAPGDNSFTRALIDSLTAMLNEYKDRPLSTFRIAQRINLDKRRKDTQAHLWSPGQNTEHHIFLAPLGRPKAPVATQPSKIRHTPGGYLTLRFGLRDASLNQEQIDYMTNTLSKALNNKHLVGLREVRWVDMKAAPPIPHFDRVALVMYVVSQWKKVIKRNKAARESQSQSQSQSQSTSSQSRVRQLTSPEAMDLSPTTSSKRAFRGADDVPGAKRQYLDPSLHPPSPPISNSSCID